MHFMALIATVLWGFPNKQFEFLLLRDPSFLQQLPEPGRDLGFCGC